MKSFNAYLLVLIKQIKKKACQTYCKKNYIFCFALQFDHN